MSQVLDGDDEAYAAFADAWVARALADDDEGAAPFALPAGMRAYDASDYVGIGRNQAAAPRVALGTLKAASIA